MLFRSNDTATTEIYTDYYTLSLHDALPIWPPGTLRIGLSWRGGTPGTRASERSIPLRDLAACVAGPGRELVSLQYGDTRAEVEGVNAELGCSVRWFPREELDDFEAFAGLVQSLDVVVSVQNTTVHTAGAVGAPCLALLPRVPEWRYMAEGEAMPWYRSVRLLRQPERGDWAPVLAQVAGELAFQSPLS